MKKISLMDPATEPLSGTELFEVVQGGVNKRIAKSVLFAVTDAAISALNALMSALGTSAFKNTGTSGNSVPLLDGANTWSELQTLAGFVITPSSTIQLPNTGIASDDVYVTSSGMNANANVMVRPSGTATASGFIAMAGSDISNAARLQFFINPAALTFSSNRTGAAAYVPMSFATGGFQRLWIETSGTVRAGGDGTQDFGSVDRRWKEIFGTKLSATTVAVSGVLSLASYTLATLPSAAANPNGQIIVTDLATGREPCSSDGTNWRKYSDRGIAA